MNENNKDDIITKRENKLYKKYISDDESENSESSESSKNVNNIKPKFIPSELRQKQEKKIEPIKEENSMDFLIKYEKIKEKQKQKDTTDEEILIDDTDDPNDIEEYSKWKIRELKRIQRDMEENTIKEKEIKEILRRRNLTDDQRKDENLKLGSDDTIRVFRSKIKFLQKYYHKGAFFQDLAADDSNHIYNRDFNLPTWEDTVDKSNLPGIIQKRRGNVFKKGQSKYTHLTAEDTNNFDPLFRVPENIVNNLLKKSGGYKGQNKFSSK